ncbi:MAG: peptidylprolyl isomerase [Myxococcota bacterium]|nr:peptidylprolyl isomerase [Myxococcota bacterium]
MRTLLLLLLALGLATGADAVPGDVDDDGIADDLDNCVDVANPDQRDDDGDGYGTVCDADLNDDGIVGAGDFFAVLRPCLNLPVASNPECAIADFDGDGVVSPADFFSGFRPNLGLPPGPKCASCPIAPDLEILPDVDVLAGSPLVIPLRGGDALGQPVIYTATSDNLDVVPQIPVGNRSLLIDVAGFGEMNFHLFEDLVPRPTGRIIELAESGFYDGIIFHRVAALADGTPFVIQAGDPTGTGTGGSTLGNFDDQFSECLQHNAVGVLSMAKTPNDDTNDSQFFVTAQDFRSLDSQHSVFGTLVRGESVRAAIQAVPVDAASKPLTDVVMQQVTVFVDDQNGVLILKAPEGASGSATITVTATDSDGVETQRSFTATIQPDPVDTPPWLADIPVIETPSGTPTDFQLEAIDPDGGALPLFRQAAPGPNLDYSVDSSSGLVTVTPSPSLPPGDYTILVGVSPTGNLGSVDTQVVTIRILP